MHGRPPQAWPGTWQPAEQQQLSQANEDDETAAALLALQGTSSAQPSHIHTTSVGEPGKPAPAGPATWRATAAAPSGTAGTKVEIGERRVRQYSPSPSPAPEPEPAQQQAQHGKHSGMPHQGGAVLDVLRQTAGVAVCDGSDVGADAATRRDEGAALSGSCGSAKDVFDSADDHQGQLEVLQDMEVDVVSETERACQVWLPPLPGDYERRRQQRELQGASGEHGRADLKRKCAELKDEDELPACRAAGGSGGGGSAAAAAVSDSDSRRNRCIWSSELHERFVHAVGRLGVKTAVPKAILQMMNVEGMTRENVASHLQKYRLALRRGGGGGSSREAQPAAVDGAGTERRCRAPELKSWDWQSPAGVEWAVAASRKADELCLVSEDPPQRVSNMAAPTLLPATMQLVHPAKQADGSDAAHAVLQATRVHAGGYPALVPAGLRVPNPLVVGPGDHTSALERRQLVGSEAHTMLTGHQGTSSLVLQQQEPSSLVLQQEQQQQGGRLVQLLSGPADISALAQHQGGQLLQVMAGPRMQQQQSHGQVLQMISGPRQQQSYGQVLQMLSGQVMYNLEVVSLQGLLSGTPEAQARWHSSYGGGHEQLPTLRPPTNMSWGP